MIPKKFKLGGVNFSTEIIIGFESADQIGISLPCLGKIKLASKYRNEDIPEDSKERTFYHELVHTILIELGELELSNNERFVDSFSSLLYQFEQTKCHE